MNPHLKRGGDADRLLNDPAFIAANEAIEKQIVDRLKSTQLDGRPETDNYCLELVRSLQAMARHQRMLWSWVDSGKVAASDIERKRLFKEGIG